MQERVPRVGRNRGAVTTRSSRARWHEDVLVNYAVVAGRRQGAAGKHQWDPGVAPDRLRRDETHWLDAATVRRSGGSVRRRVMVSSPEKWSAATLVSSESYGAGRER
jgi:hypothetical protein